MDLSDLSYLDPLQSLEWAREMPIGPPVPGISSFMHTSELSDPLRVIPWDPWIYGLSSPQDIRGSGSSTGSL